MAKVDEALESVLEGYASFLRERMLAPLKHQPYLVQWVQEYPLSCPAPDDKLFEIARARPLKSSKVVQ